MVNGKHKRDTSAQYPHFIGIRITDRQFKDLQEIQRLTPNHPPISNMIRDSLGLWIAQRLHSLDTQK
jgi:hypothetical protein